jgi:tetratricopeptide (TPR) repeat protein
MMELSGATHAAISTLCEQGDSLALDEDYRDALVEYGKAWALLPEPKYQWEAASWVLAAIGDTLFLLGQYEKAGEVFREAVIRECPGARENPFVRFRRGQCAFETGDRQMASEELAAAFMLAGDEIFEDEDPKYFEYLKTALKPPHGGWAEEK